MYITIKYVKSHVGKWKGESWNSLNLEGLKICLQIFTPILKKKNLSCECIIHNKHIDEKHYKDMHLVFRWKVEGQVAATTLGGGDDVCAYASDLWFYLHNAAVVTYQPCQASAPQTCQRLWLISDFCRGRLWRSKRKEWIDFVLEPGETSLTMIRPDHGASAKPYPFMGVELERA